MISNKKLEAWVKKLPTYATGRHLLVRRFTGEYDRMLQETVDIGMATPLNPEKRPGCVLFRSSSDVAC